MDTQAQLLERMAITVDEIMINDHPAALIHGGWDADRQEWDESIIITLMCKIGDQACSLMSSTLDVEVMIRIAESIPAP